jgi:subtilisin family serine protease
VHKRTCTSLVGFFLALVLSAAEAHSQAQPGTAGNGSDYIVVFRDNVTAAERAAITGREGAAIRFNYTTVSAAAVRVPNENALSALSNNAAVLRVIPDRPIFAIQAPAAATKSKPGGGETSGQTVPLGVVRVGTPTAAGAAVPSDGNGIGVAVVDTGIDFAHADLAPSATSFTAFGSSCQDNNGHGTHVTGTIAALDNSIGVIGVAPKATPYCVKVLDASGSGSDATLIAGLDWVRQNRNTVTPPIRVVNMSLGREGTLDDNPALHAVVKALYDAGIVTVVAAGNDPSLEVSQNVPATYPEVFAVASTTAAGGSNKCRFLSSAIAADTASFFSSDGKLTGLIGVTISAPGEDREDVSSGCLISSAGILSTNLGGGTTRKSGTSMAAPHVSGIVARYIQKLGTGLKPEDIRTLLRGNAQGFGSAPLNSPTSSYSYDGEREGVAKAP